jgi:hypothetical protein
MVAVFPTTLGSGISTVGGVFVAASGKRWELGIVVVSTRNMASEAGEHLQVWSNWKEMNVWVLRTRRVSGW